MLLTVSQVANMCDVHPNTVRNWIHRDGLRAYRTPSRYLLITKEDLMQFLANLYD